MSKPLHEMDGDELRRFRYDNMSDEERQENIFHRTEVSKHAIDKANENIQELIYLNKRQIETFKNYHRQFISLSAFLVACIIAILLNVAY